MPGRHPPRVDGSMHVRRHTPARRRADRGYGIRGRDQVGVSRRHEPGAAQALAPGQQLHRRAGLPGTALLPGLIDTHTHLYGNDQPDAIDRLPGLSPDELDQTVVAALTRRLAAGITAVRDLGGVLTLSTDITAIRDTA